MGLAPGSERSDIPSSTVTTTTTLQSLSQSTNTMVVNASYPVNDANQSSSLESMAFFASEGVYQVTKHFFIEQAIPNLTIGTRITLVTIKSRDSTTNHQNMTLDHLGKVRAATTTTTTATNQNHNFGQDGSAIVSEAASSATSSTIRTDEEDGSGSNGQAIKNNLSMGQNGIGKGDGGSESDQSIVMPTSATSNPFTSTQSVGSRLAAAAVMIPRVGPLRRAESMQAQTNNSNQLALSDMPSPRASTPTLAGGTSTTETGTTIGSSASSNSLAAIFSSGGNGRRSKPKNDVNRTTSSFLMRSNPQEMMNPTMNMNVPTLGSAANSTSASTTMSTRFSSAISSTANGSQEEQRNGRVNNKNTNGTISSSSNNNNNNIQVPGIQKDTFIFFNIGRTFYWSGLDAKDPPVSYINFSKAYPTCHDVNLLTRDSKHLDVIIGFSTGDIIWFDPLCNRYHRLNKQGVVNGSAVTAIQWIPGSDQLFMVAFKDGCMAIFDRDKDDQPVSLQSSHRNTKFHVTRAPKGSKHNPTSYWQVSPRTVTAFAISPDCQHMAMTSMDGRLRIVDLIQEELIHTFESYFGGLTCVAWSPDGKYIITGGQDDLVSIWSFIDHCIVARCQGHQSWITDVAFDNWRCDEDQYRFGSVGEDGQILLWDFSVQTLGKPKRRNSITSSSGIHGKRLTHSESSESLTSNQPTSANATNSAMNSQRSKTKDTPPLHHALPRSQVPILRPIAGMVAHEDPISSIIFQEKYLLTTCCRGHIKLWSRPFSSNSVSSVVANLHHLPGNESS